MSKYIDYTHPDWEMNPIMQIDTCIQFLKEYEKQYKTPLPLLPYTIGQLIRCLTDSRKALMDKTSLPDEDKIIEEVARAIQKDFPIVQTGSDEQGNWCARPLEIEVFKRTAKAAISCYKKLVG